MKKIILSLSAIALVAVVAVSATTALFSDTETSTGNTISAGTLDLSVNGENPVTSKFTLADVKPGDSGSYPLVLANVGSIAASHLYLSVSSLTDTEGANPEPETNIVEPGDLSGVVTVSIKDGATVLWTGTLTALNALPIHTIDVGALGASPATKTITLEASIDSGVGNDIMGDISTFNIVAELVQ
jgi:spore coat-associated protein N